MKILYAIIIAVIIVLVALFAFNSFIYNEKQADQPPAQSAKDATYVIDGEVVTLTDGFAETEAAPGASSKITTRYFGNEVTKDLNGDGRDDVVFLLTQETGGSGTLYYVVAALNLEEGYAGSQAFLLGDRIAPQTTEPGRGLIVVVNYADRAPGEPFTTQPSVGKSVWLKLDVESMQFGTVEQNFEGEADIASPAFAEYFQNALFKKGTEDGLIPIEGFDADLLLGKFPGLVAADFDGVLAFEGRYRVENGDVVFVRTQAQPISSAERTVSREGYSVLLQNIITRLGLPLRKDSDIDALINVVSL